MDVFTAGANVQQALLRKSVFDSRGHSYHSYFLSQVQGGTVVTETCQFAKH